MDEITILRNALLDISTNRVNGKPTVSAGTALIALQKVRQLESRPDFTETQSQARLMPLDSPSFIRL